MWWKSLSTSRSERQNEEHRNCYQTSSCGGSTNDLGVENGRPRVNKCNRDLSPIDRLGVTEEVPTDEHQDAGRWDLSTTTSRSGESCGGRCPKAPVVRW